MKYLTMITLIVAGIIHLLPLSGVLGSSQLASLYGLEVEDPNLLILLRHRAVLFALLGAFLVAAAFKPSMRPTAILAGLISTIAFLWLALAAPDYNSSIATVIYADVIAIVCLLVAAVTKSRSEPA